MNAPIGVIVCSRRTARECHYCAKRVSDTRLCDYPVTRSGKPATCDVVMCARCATPGGKNIDYCRPHAQLMREPRQRGVSNG